MFKKFISHTLKSAVSFLVAVFLFFCSLSGITPEVFAGKEAPIPVVITFDENYLYPAIVSVSSMLKNANEKTFYNIYALVPGEFTAESRQKLLSLQESYGNCEIVIIDMKDEFQKYVGKDKYPAAIFYVLKLFSTLPPNAHKCIYLDCDTLVCKDLNELYQQEIGDNYVAGVPDVIRLGETWGTPERFTVGVPALDRYINSGVLLWNLDKCREDNIEAKLLQFLDQNHNGYFHDQCTINAVCYPKIKDLPFKFNTQTYFGLEKEYGESRIKTSCFSKSDWDEGRKNPVILHYCAFKPWNEPGIYAKWWWNTARETAFGEQILRKYLPLLPEICVNELFGAEFISKLFFSPESGRPKVSVIIPIYNSEKWLEKCLNSVVTQTLRDIEIICINDASTDKSLEIIQKFKRKDPRIKIIDKKVNEGAPSARNAGLSVATGEFIGFVDSDDWIDNKTFAVAYKTAVEKESDVVTFGAWFSPDSVRKYYQGPVRNATYTENAYEQMYPPAGVTTVWSRIYKKSLLDRCNAKFEIRLPATHNQLFNTLIAPYVKSVSVLRAPFYHYIRRQTGIVNTMKITAESLIFDAQVCIEEITKLKPDSIPPHVLLNFTQAAETIIDGAIARTAEQEDYNPVVSNPILYGLKKKLGRWFIQTNDGSGLR